MTENKHPEDRPEAGADESSAATKPRRAYTPPKLLSVEPLEAAAATCDPPTGGFGKSPPACNPRTLGS
jgi:hypothetical protein